MNESIHETMMMMTMLMMMMLKMADVPERSEPLVPTDVTKSRRHILEGSCIRVPSAHYYGWHNFMNGWRGTPTGSL